MAFNIRKVDYFYVSIKDEPGAAYKLLSRLANAGINLIAFAAIPIGPNSLQLTLFPENTTEFTSRIKRVGLTIIGPHQALYVSGDDELGALANIHVKLFEANVNLFASTGVVDGKGSYGYIMYVRPDDFERALTALGVQ